MARPRSAAQEPGFLPGRILPPFFVPPFSHCRSTTSEPRGGQPGKLSHLCFNVERESPAAVPSFREGSAGSPARSLPLSPRGLGRRGEENAASEGGHRPFPAGLGDPDPLPFAQFPEIRVFEALKNALPSPPPLKRRVSLMGGGCFARKRRGGGGGGLGRWRVAASREEERQHMDAIVSIRFRCFAFLAFCLLKSPPEKGFFYI